MTSHTEENLFLWKAKVWSYSRCSSPLHWCPLVPPSLSFLSSPCLAPAAAPSASEPAGSSVRASACAWVCACVETGGVKRGRNRRGTTSQPGGGEEVWVCVFPQKTGKPLRKNYTRAGFNPTSRSRCLFLPGRVLRTTFTRSCGNVPRSLWNFTTVFPPLLLRPLLLLWQQQLSWLLAVAPAAPAVEWIHWLEQDCASAPPRLSAAYPPGSGTMRDWVRVPLACCRVKPARAPIPWLSCVFLFIFIIIICCCVLGGMRRLL